MTQAVSAQGDKIFVKVGGTWKRILEMKSTPEVGEEVSKIDASNLDSEVKEYIKDLPDQTDLTFVFNAMPLSADESNTQLLMDLSRSEIYEWKYQLSTLGIQFIFRGEFSYKVGAGAVSSVREISLTIVPRTRPVEMAISETYSVTYDPNGGTGTLADAESYDSGELVTLKKNTFIPPEGKIFSVWSTTESGVGASYDESDSFRIYGDVTIYAQWVDE